MRSNVKHLFVVGLALTLGPIGAVHAVPMLKLTSGADERIVVDGDGNDASPLAGFVVYNGNISGWAIALASGLSKPMVGSADHPFMDLTSVALNESAGAVLNIWLTDTDFSPVINAGSVLAQIGGTSFGNVSYRTFYDPSNTPFGTAMELTNLGPFSGAFSGTAGDTLSSAGPYSLTMLVTVSHLSPWRVSSFDADVKVPEPGSLLLLGVGLLAMVPFVRRTRSAARAA